MEYWDVYTLISERNPQKLLEYARDLIPNLDLEQASDEYSLDIGADQLSINNAKEFIYSGCHHKKSEGAIRLNGNARRSPNGGWIYFNQDGSTVFGVTVKERESKSTLSSLMQVCSSRYAYVAGDCPPAESEREFISKCT